MPPVFRRDHIEFRLFRQRLDRDFRFPDAIILNFDFSDISALKKKNIYICRKNDISAIKNDISAIRTDIPAVENYISAVKNDISAVNTGPRFPVSRRDHIEFRLFRQRLDRDFRFPDAIILNFDFSDKDWNKYMSAIKNYISAVKNNISAVKNDISAVKIDISAVKKWYISAVRNNISTLNMIYQP